MPSEPGIQRRIEIGRIWEMKLYHHLMALPELSSLIRFPEGNFGIDFAIKSIRGNDLWIDAKSDIRTDTFNHSIQANLPRAYAARYPRRSVIVFDDFTAISPEKVLRVAIAANPGTRPGRTAYLLIPKCCCAPFDKVWAALI